VGRQRFETETDNTYLANQTDVRGDFETGFAKHTVNAGLELSREWRAQHRDNLNALGLATGPNLPADLFHPEPSPDLAPVASVFSSATDTQQWTAAVYAADQVALSKYVEVLGSARFDVFSTHFTSESADATARLQSKDRFLNWRAGLVFHPVEKTSLYAMYGTSSNPSAETGVIASGTESLEPERNTTYEVGAKAELLEERLGLNAAVFRTDKTNARVPNTDPEGPAIILEGAQRVQGFNVGVVGTLT
jgi:catecholate siderophore receptor